MITIKKENDFNYVYLIIVFGVILVAVIFFLIYKYGKTSDYKINIGTSGPTGPEGPEGRRGPAGPTESIKPPTILYDNNPMPVWIFSQGDSLIYKSKRNHDTKILIQPIKIEEGIETGFSLIINNQRRGPLKIIAIDNIVFNVHNIDKEDEDNISVMKEYTIPGGVSCQIAAIPDENKIFNLTVIMCSSQVL